MDLWVYTAVCWDNGQFVERLALLETRPEVHEWRSLLPLKSRAPTVTEMTTGYFNMYKCTLVRVCMCVLRPRHMFFPVHCGCWLRTREPLSMTIWSPLHIYDQTVYPLSRIHIIFFLYHLVMMCVVFIVRGKFPVSVNFVNPFIRYI